MALSSWFMWIVAVVLFALIGWTGLSFLRGIARNRPKEKVEPEDVTDFDVFFVCRECGTEFQVTRLGEAQVPRHCGEPMSAVRRPGQDQVTN